MGQDECSWKKNLGCTLAIPILWYAYCILSSGGLIFLKLKYNAMSYANKTPPNTNGADKKDSDCSI